MFQGRTGKMGKGYCTLFLSATTYTVLLAALVAGQDGAARKLLQMEALAGGLMGAGQEGGDTCLTKGSSLVSGACAPFVQAFKANADAIVHADEATFNHAVQTAPKPQPQCCVDATAFVTGGCACDESVVNFAPYMGLNNNALITIARAATVVCSIPNNPCVVQPAPAQPAPVPTPVATPAATVQPVVAAPVVAAPVVAAPVVAAAAPLAAKPPVMEVIPMPAAAPIAAAAPQAAAAPIVGTAAPVAAPMAQALPHIPEAAPSEMRPPFIPVQPIPLGQVQQPGPMNPAQPRPQQPEPNRYAFQIPEANAGNRVVRWFTRPEPASTIG